MSIEIQQPPGIPASSAGVAGGVATLDGTGRLPTSQLTLDAVQYKGAWNASTNSPTLADGTGNTGDFYRVSVGATRNLGSGSLEWRVGDTVIYSGTIWERIPSADIIPVAQIRYVRSYGSDTVGIGDGSLERPWATIAFAESQITDNASNNQYVLDIGRGSYTVAAAYAKKTFIHWQGAGRDAENGTSISLSGGAGGLVITPTTTGESVVFSNLLMNTSTGGIIVNQTGYKTATSNATSSLTLRMLHCQTAFATVNQITFNGTDHNVNSLVLFGCQLGNGLTVRSCGLVMFFTYAANTITVTENASQPSTPVSITVNTTAGSGTVTLVGGNTYGLVGGTKVSGTGIIPGAISALAVPTTTLTIDKPATLTQTGVTITADCRRHSTAQIFKCRISGLTVDKQSSCSFTDGSYNAGNVTLNDSGSSLVATADTLRGTLTQGAGTYLNYNSTNTKGIRYVPSAPQNWDANTFTVTIASPAVFTKTAHGLAQGTSLMLSTTGSLPTGLNSTTVYYVFPIDANTFFVSTAPEFSNLVTTTGTQSGVHSYSRIPENLLQALDQGIARVKTAETTIAAATSSNTPSTLVLRGASGESSHGVLTSTGLIRVTGSRGTPTLVDATPAITIQNSGIQKVYVAGNGGPVTVTANPQIPVGTIDGQELILVGRDDTNTVTYSNGTGLSLNGPVVLTEDLTIRLSWDGTNWVEMSRSS